MITTTRAALFILLVTTVSTQIENMKGQPEHSHWVDKGIQLLSIVPTTKYGQLAEWTDTPVNPRSSRGVILPCGWEENPDGSIGPIETPVAEQSLDVNETAMPANAAKGPSIPLGPDASAEDTKTNDDVEKENA